MPRSLFQTTAPFLSREQAKALTDRVLALRKADEMRVNISTGWNGNTRFAGAEITTSGGITDTTLTVIATFGRRRASATTNVLDEESLRRTVDLAERLARLAPEDPQLMPELGPQTYLTVPAYVDRTAALSPEARADAVKRLIDTARRVGREAGDLFVAGFLDANAQATVIATSRGLFAYHAQTDVSLSTTVRTPDGTGSGWAGGAARDWGLIDPETLGRRAAEKAVASRNAVAVEPGMYTAVLEPAAVASLLPRVAGSLDARSVDEGRSPYSKAGGGSRLGEKIADERITLFSDPSDPDLLAQPFDGEGLPIKRNVWVENGVLRNLSYSRYWAQQKGKEPTGGGGGGGFGGVPGGLKVPGGTKTVEQLIAETERGILVTQFFYTNVLDARNGLMTGLTRDGTFLIERGRIARAVKNFRFNESPLIMVNKIEEIGRAERTRVGQVLPALRVRDFNFASLSDAV
ncbi:MAG TPA: TldD/PmbA family protein [Gemmatimonadaceae bacterium]|nr:TldD/PmbA family protein [Gemmatimonadaceae bacterium]